MKVEEILQDQTSEDQTLEDPASEEEVIELHFMRSVSGGDEGDPGESSPYSLTIGLSADPEELALLQDILAELQASAERESSTDEDLQAVMFSQELLEDSLAALHEQNRALQNGFLAVCLLLGLIAGALVGIGLWFGRLNNK